MACERAKLAGTDESVVPFLDSDSPYYVVNGEDWDMRTLHVEGNGCLDCHRIGHRTVDRFDQLGYDINEMMPPDEPGSLSEDFRKLREAWNKGPYRLEAAEWRVPRAGDVDAHAVGDDYPFKK